MIKHFICICIYSKMKAKEVKAVGENRVQLLLVFFFGQLPNPLLFLWAAAKTKVVVRPTFTFLPLGHLMENQSISTSSFLLHHNHVAYVSTRPQENLLKINLSVFIGLVKTSARFSLVWIFCKSTLSSSTTSRTK